jgi:hypothetical protein
MDTRNVERILTLTDAGKLADVLRATEGNRKVARLVNGDVITGTARRFGDQNGAIMWDTDIRDQFLWVTTSGGFETWWKVSELMQEVQSGEFVIGYES